LLTYGELGFDLAICFAYNIMLIGRAILHDKNTYFEPFAFKPERFLAREDGGLEEPDCMSIVFGYGRRICPGRYLAEKSLFIYAARILAVLSISPAKDDTGADILPAMTEDLAGHGVIRFALDSIGLSSSD
jgi:cytochrome P450